MQVKAQASLELMLLLAAFLSVLAITTPAAMRLKQSMESGARQAEAQAALWRIAGASEGAYLLGEGNARELRAPALYGWSFSASGGTLKARSGELQAEAGGNFDCKPFSRTLAQGEALHVRCCEGGMLAFTASTETP
jgi:hypothetical protein